MQDAPREHDYGGVGMPERLSLSAAWPRCEVLRIISGTDQDGKRESASIASKKLEFELVRGTLGQVGQRRMPVEADPGWRIVAAASVAAINRTLPRGAQPSRQRQSDLVSFADRGKKEHGSSAVSRTTGRPAEVLREGSGITVDGTAGDGLTMSTKDAGNLPWQKTSRAWFIIDGRWAMSCCSGHWPGRVFSPYEITSKEMQSGCLSQVSPPTLVCWLGCHRSWQDSDRLSPETIRNVLDRPGS